MEGPGFICCGGGPIDKEAVTVWDEDKQRSVCNLCGSDRIESGYGLGGGGGPGLYNYCCSCERILDKRPDAD